MGELLNNNPQSLEDIKWSMIKCVRCNMCKFPPLARIEQKQYGIGCPSFDLFKFHPYSGGGKLIMAASLLEERSEATEIVQKVAYSCNLCGACDVSCKFGSDIELLDILFLLRTKLFKKGLIYPEHQTVLDHIKKYGHPFSDIGEGKMQIPENLHQAGAETLVWVGAHFSYDPFFKEWLNNMLQLLKKGGIKFQLLMDQEPYSGRAALEIGDRELFYLQSNKVSNAIKESRAKKIVCLSAEDYSTLRSQTPRFSEINVPISHISEEFEILLKKERLKKKGELPYKNIGWHDPNYLGRLGGSFKPWSGTNDKAEGGIRVYDPPRKIDYGSGGVFNAPRNVLKLITKKPILEFSLKKEYCYSAGETGQSQSVQPILSENAAKKRIQEALDCNIETIVTECPLAFQSLKAATQNSPNIQVCSLTELLTTLYL